jgi:hypothetical protein
MACGPPDTHISLQIAAISFLTLLANYGQDGIRRNIYPQGHYAL